MKNSGRVILLSSIILLLAAGCGGSRSADQLISRSANQQISPPVNQQAPIKKYSGSDDSKLEQNPQATTTPPQHQATSTGDSENSPSCLIPPHTGKPDYKPGYVIVSQTVDGSSCNELYTQIMKGATAQDLLTIAHKIDFDNYGSMGIFVTSIDGVTPDSKHFWELYINGKSSNLGASNYTLVDGDKIEWKISVIN